MNQTISIYAVRLPALYSGRDTLQHEIWTMADMGGATTMDDPAQASAQELIDRLDTGALQFAKDRIKNLSTESDPRERDQAYRLLTALEDLLDKEEA